MFILGFSLDVINIYVFFFFSYILPYAFLCHLTHLHQKFLSHIFICCILIFKNCVSLHIIICFSFSFLLLIIIKNFLLFLLLGIFNFYVYFLCVPLYFKFYFLFVICLINHYQNFYFILLLGIFYFYLFHLTGVIQVYFGIYICSCSNIYFTRNIDLFLLV